MELTETFFLVYSAIKQFEVVIFLLIVAWTPGPKEQRRTKKLFWRVKFQSLRLAR